MTSFRIALMVCCLFWGTVTQGQVDSPFPRQRIDATTLHPLQIESVRSTESAVHLRIHNHSAASKVCTVSGRSATIPAHASEELAIPCGGMQPFEMNSLTIRSADLAPLRVPVFIYRPGAPSEWIVRRAGPLTVEFAKNGSGARILLQDRPMGVIAPFVHRDGDAPALQLTEQGDTVRFSGDGTTVEFVLHDNEIRVSVNCADTWEGPVVRPLGELEQGLFAGLEYLGKGERSSSTADIETPEHWRYAPDPLRVTMPLMVCRTESGATAMSWTDMTLQPVFASPNFLDGAPGHRMSLRGKNFEFVIRMGQFTLEDMILWSVQKHGFPPVPAAPRSAVEQHQLCLAALNGPLRNNQGWGHCAEANWQRLPYADMASTLFRLTGRVTPGDVVSGGSHIRNDAIYFFTGRADQWLAEQRARVADIIHEQQSDSSFRYEGKYLRGHFENTASGYCAAKAVSLLEFARMSGDQAAHQAGVRTLDYMKRFCTPRGAQTWELSLHTPDILAAAHLVQSYTTGYELSGKQECLDEARRWALSGIPFVYLWGCQPVMTYATIPVYGATNWQAPNWIGLPVQWCGVVYAYALTRLAHHDQTLDWNHLARGILHAAEQMQYPDGPLAGCLPDVFYLKAQRRAGPSINPCALVSLRSVLDGSLDNLAVATDGQHRIVAPFPVTIQNGTAHVQGQPGTTYEALLDGKASTVQSLGHDRVGLARAEKIRDVPR
jgi:hypothetical protein